MNKREKPETNQKNQPKKPTKKTNQKNQPKKQKTKELKIKLN